MADTNYDDDAVFVRADFDYDPQRDDELALAPGAVIQVLDGGDDAEWLMGRDLATGQEGWFPSNFVSPTDPPSTSPAPRRPPPAPKAALPPPPPVVPVTAASVPEPARPAPTAALPAAPPAALNKPVPETKTTAAHRTSTLVDPVPAAPAADDATGVTVDNDDASTAADDKPEAPQPARVLYDYAPQNADELNLIAGTTISVLSTDIGVRGWYRGEVDGQIGIFPANHVKLVEKDSDAREKKLAAIGVRVGMGLGALFGGMPAVTKKRPTSSVSVAETPAPAAPSAPSPEPATSTDDTESIASSPPGQGTVSRRAAGLTMGGIPMPGIAMGCFPPLRATAPKPATPPAAPAPVSTPPQPATPPPMTAPAPALSSARAQQAGHARMPSLPRPPAGLLKARRRESELAEASHDDQLQSSQDTISVSSRPASIVSANGAAAIANSPKQDARELVASPSHDQDAQDDPSIPEPAHTETNGEADTQEHAPIMASSDSLGAPTTKSEDAAQDTLAESTHVTEQPRPVAIPAAGPVLTPLTKARPAQQKRRPTNMRHLASGAQTTAPGAVMASSESLHHEPAAAAPATKTEVPAPAPAPVPSHPPPKPASPVPSHAAPRPAVAPKPSLPKASSTSPVAGRGRVSSAIASLQASLAGGGPATGPRPALPGAKPLFGFIPPMPTRKPSSHPDSPHPERENSTDSQSTRKATSQPDSPHPERENSTGSQHAPVAPPVVPASPAARTRSTPVPSRTPSTAAAAAPVVPDRPRHASPTRAASPERAESPVRSASPARSASPVAPPRSPPVVPVSPPPMPATGLGIVMPEDAHHEEVDDTPASPPAVPVRPHSPPAVPAKPTSPVMAPAVAPRPESTRGRSPSPAPPVAPRPESIRGRSVSPAPIVPPRTSSRSPARSPAREVAAPAGKAEDMWAAIVALRQEVASLRAALDEERAAREALEAKLLGE
ncbi:SH3-domain kinase binding protein 1 [Allomyces javanicus]|nr:SH3-domain kinase binding protein 1 [Allomyces javanicus]